MVKHGVNFCKFNSNCKTHLSVLFFIRWTVTDQSKINLKKKKDWLMEFHCGYYEQNVVCCLHEWLWRQQWSKNPPLAHSLLTILAQDSLPVMVHHRKKKKKKKNEHGEIKMSVPLRCKVWLRYQRKRGNVEEARRGVYQKFDRNNFSERLDY